MLPDTPLARCYSLSLHDALPIFAVGHVEAPMAAILNRPVTAHRTRESLDADRQAADVVARLDRFLAVAGAHRGHHRSEEHTSELQSRQYLVSSHLLQEKNTVKDQ